MRDSIIYILMSALFAAFFVQIAWAGVLSVSVTSQRGVMDIGQSSIMSANVTGGNGNYTCSWTYYPLNDPSLVSSFANQSCTVAFYGNASDKATPDVVVANADDNISDSGVGQVFVSVKSQLVLSITPSSSAVLVGQGVSVSNSTSGGSQPYGNYTYTIPATGITENGNGFTFTSPGVYEITESVRDANAGTASASTNVTVTPVIQSGPTTTALTTTLANGGSINAGSSETDSANLTNGNSPTGTITFYTFATPDCSGTGTAVGTASSVLGNGVYNSASAGPYTSGTYSWDAIYSGDANNTAAVSQCEVLTVVHVVANTSISTTLANGGSINMGSSETDLATLSGASNPTGTIKFYTFQTSTCSGNATQVGTASTVSGNGNYASSSAGPYKAGTYSWDAVYSGDFNNTGATSQCEVLTVIHTFATTSITTILANGGTINAGSSETDSATLSGGNAPSGTIRFYTFTTSNCGGAASAVGTASAVSGNGNYLSSSVGPYGAGTYSWDAVYSGDANNTGSTSQCEVLTVISSLVTKLNSNVTTVTATGKVKFWNVTTGGSGSNVYTYTVNGLTAFSSLGISEGSGAAANVFTFGNAGSYLVAIGVKDATGQTSTSSVVITVMPAPVNNCGCKGGNNNGKPITITGSAKTEVVTITNQSAVYITGSSNNVTVHMSGSDCNVAIYVTGSTNKLSVYNGTITLSETGSSNVATLHSTVVTSQSITGSSDRIAGAILDGNSFTITGSSNLVESVQIENLDSLLITGSGSNVTATMLGTHAIATTITGSSNLLHLVNGVISLRITGSSNNVYYHSTTITSQSITGSGNKVTKD